jgi:hypothetical protein
MCTHLYKLHGFNFVKWQKLLAYIWALNMFYGIFDTLCKNYTKCVIFVLKTSTILGYLAIWHLSARLQDFE